MGSTSSNLMRACFLLLIGAGCGSTDDPIDPTPPPQDPCAAISCGAHGSCVAGGCSCRDGYSGGRCEIPPGNTQSCTPDSRFCDGTKMRQCTADGMSSVLEGDCAGAAVTNQCGDCGGYVLCVSSSPYCSGNASGAISGSWSTNGCAPSCSASSSANTILMTFSVNGSAILISADALRASSGATVSTVWEQGGQPAPAVWTGFMRGSDNCSSLIVGAPAGGTAQLSYGSRTAGDEITVQFNGHVQCSGVWEALTISARSKILY